MIAERIHQYLKVSGISLDYLCGKTELSTESMEDVFAGRRNLEIDEYASICLALNVSFDFFFGRHASCSAQNQEVGTQEAVDGNRDS